MKLRGVIEAGQVFINKMGAVIVVTKTTLDTNEVDFLIEYKIASSAVNYYDHKYEYKLQKEESFIEMLKANYYISIS